MNATNDTKKRFVNSENKMRCRVAIDKLNKVKHRVIEFVDLTREFDKDNYFADTYKLEVRERSVSVTVKLCPAFFSNFEIDGDEAHGIANFRSEERILARLVAEIWQKLKTTEILRRKSGAFDAFDFENEYLNTFNYIRERLTGYAAADVAVVEDIVDRLKHM